MGWHIGPLGHAGGGKKKSGPEQVVGLHTVGSWVGEEKCLAGYAQEQSWVEVGCS
jgi:hypothetical protein